MTSTIKRIAVLVLTMATTVVPTKSQVRVSSLGGLVGWMVIEDTNISGSFEGADFDKVAKLENGRIIEFHEYDYFYEYHPEIVIFGKKVGNVVLYKAVIEGGDDVYDITFLK